VRKRKRALGDGAPAHPDHLFVRDALLKSLEQLGSARVLLYDELPYLWTLNADAEVARLAERNGVSAKQFDVEIDRVEKQRALRSYASQLSALDPAGRLHDASLLNPVERYWLVYPAGQDRSWS